MIRCDAGEKGVDEEETHRKKADRCSKGREKFIVPFPGKAHDERKR